MDDFKDFTGSYADLNGDGKVDFTEYDSDCYDFERVHKNSRSSGKYNPQQQSTDETQRIYCAWGIVGWILAFIGCFMPIINTFIYTDGEEIGLGIILTIILLAAWIFGFSNRSK